MDIILASSSVARSALMKRLQIPFKVFPPNIDESPLPFELPNRYVTRLAYQKALAIALKFPKSIVIGADQVCVYKQAFYGKPKTFSQAFMQLKEFSNKKVYFYGAVSVIYLKNKSVQKKLHITTVYYKKLSSPLIRAYLNKDKPYSCAGSLRSESLGLMLCKKIISPDPSALIGMSLIDISQMLNIIKPNFILHYSIKK
ncbi:MAG: Maf family protein [Methylacidiphilales bacterium]|nr:Maf family protein [Candidatus Methylacidiphilales bacterium]